VKTIELRLELEPVCPRCAGDGWIETCRADGEDCRRETCPVCEGWSAEDEREGDEAAYAEHIDRQIDRMQDGDF
jgi:hypothetical protein